MTKESGASSKKPRKKSVKKAKKPRFIRASASAAASIGGVRGWVVAWFEHVMGRTVEPDETLKSLRYTADNDLHAMNLEFNATFTAELTTNEFKAECTKPKETVGMVAAFLSNWLLVHKHAQSG